MILLPHFDIPYGFGLGKIPQVFPFQGPVFFVQCNVDILKTVSRQYFTIQTFFYYSDVGLNS